MPSAAKFDSIGAREHSAIDTYIDTRNRAANGRSTSQALERNTETN